MSAASPKLRGQVHPDPRSFQDACWDFPTSDARRELHPYPARFIPEIPGQALDLLEVDGPVLDPFCGSGTTLLEARRRGLPTTGIDLNPIACLISRVRTQAWKPAEASRGLEESRRLHHHALEGGDLKAVAQRIPRIDHWFDPWSQEALAGAVRYLDHVADPVWQDRIAVAISSVVVRVSRQESDTRYAAVGGAETRSEAAADLGRSIVRVCEWLATNAINDSRSSTTVVCDDAQAVGTLTHNFYAAAVFSPPYPNAYEYWLYHKYRMYWLGFDPIGVRSAELGARPHYCKPNGLTARDFKDQMTTVFGGLAQVLQPGAPTVIVVGDSIIRGRRVDNGKLLTDAAQAQGFTKQVATKRVIRRQRSSFNRAHNRGRKVEHVLLLRAP